MRFEIKKIVLIITTLTAFSITGCSVGYRSLIYPEHNAVGTSEQSDIGASKQSNYIDKSEIPDKESYTAVAGNDNFYLYYQQETMDVLIVNRATGSEWNMIPEGWEKDEHAVGPARLYLPSAVILDVFDKNRQITNISSYAECIKKNSYTVRETASGFDVEYRFKNAEIKMTIEYEITDSGLMVSIPSDKIQEGSAENLISKITLMPFFGSSGLSDNGYMLVPDGCGALIDFTGKISKIRQQSNVVYGFDSGISLTSMPSPSQNYLLPVFGIKNDEGAMLGIVTKGDGMVRIVSAVAGAGASSYRTYPVFTQRDLHTLFLYEGKSNERHIVDISPNRTKVDFTVEYRFPADKEAGYPEMAECYRDYLLENNMLRRNESSFKMDLSVIGAVREQKTMIGVPFISTESLTNFEETENILSELKSGGVDSISLDYYGINKGGYHNEKLGGFVPEKVIGGKKGLNKLLVYTHDNNIDFIINADILDICNTGGKFSLRRDSVKQLTGSYVKQWVWNLIDGGKQTNKFSYLLEPRKISKYVEEKLRTIPDNTSLKVIGIGEKLYSQFGEKSFTDRNNALEYWHETLSLISKNNDEVVVDVGNGYVLPYATFISNLPVSSSGTDMETRDIPFYQLVVHGYIPYSSSAGNFRVNRRTEFLKMIEYGAFPKWIWGAGESSRLKETAYNSLYSTNYKDWIGTAVEEYSILKDIYDETGWSSMISHKMISENVYLTSYENGISIAVNYGNSDYLFEDTIVAGMDYAVMKDDNNEK